MRASTTFQDTIVWTILLITLLIEGVFLLNQIQVKLMFQVASGQ